MSSAEKTKNTPIKWYIQSNERLKRIPRTHQNEIQSRKEHENRRARSSLDEIQRNRHKRQGVQRARTNVRTQLPVRQKRNKVYRQNRRRQELPLPSRSKNATLRRSPRRTKKRPKTQKLLARDQHARKQRRTRTRTENRDRKSVV